LFENPKEKPELPGVVVGVLTIWCILLVLGAPWALMGTGMAFEGGPTFSFYLFISTVWSYPVLLGVSFLFRRRKPILIWLPAIPVLVSVASILFNW